jgi:hypothetical protein
MSPVDGGSPADPCAGATEIHVPPVPGLCSAQTIGLGLAMALGDARIDTVRVGPGTFTATTSRETFPLWVRRGTSLIGAGRDQTRIVGIGSPQLDLPTGGSSLVTLATDDGTPVRVSNLEIVAPDQPGPRIGIACTNESGMESPDAPTLIVDNVSFRGAYGAGVLVTGHDHPASPSSCNAQITGSVFRDGDPTGSSAVLVVGNGSAVQARATIGSPNAAENVVSGYQVGVSIGDGVAAVAVRNTTVEDSSYGVNIVEASSPAAIDIAGDRFLNLATAGVALQGVARVATLTDNRFMLISAADKSGAAVRLDGPATSVGLARRNCLLRNDNGVVLGNGSDAGDWGTDRHPGANVLAANGPGYALRDNATSTGAAALFFSGNLWNGGAPSVTHQPGEAAEVLCGTAVMLDVSGGSAYAGRCP